MTREIEPADVTTLYERLANLSVEAFNEHKVFPPQLITIELGDETAEIKRMVFVDSYLVDQFHATAERKDLMMTFIRVLLSAGRAPFPAGTSLPELPEGFLPHAVVHISECWAVEKPVSTAEPQSSDPLDGHGSVKRHPERGEVLMINVHTSERSYGGICPITGTGSERRASFGPLLIGGGRLSLNDEDGHDLH